MRAAWLALLIGCAGTPATRPPPADPGDSAHSVLADEELYKPSYGRPELSRALISERAAEATAERKLAELAEAASSPALDDQQRVAAADLAVRRRFISTLEACESVGRYCPPRLDDPPWAFDPDAEGQTDPPMSASLRFDLESWRTLASELHGRACACRTLACVDSVGVAIDQLEIRPRPEVQDDEAAATSITRARECLFRLRGKSVVRATKPDATPEP